MIVNYAVYMSAENIYLSLHLTSRQTKIRENQLPPRINLPEIMAIDSQGSSSAENVITNLISPQQRLPQHQLIA